MGGLANKFGSPVGRNHRKTNVEVYRNDGNNGKSGAIIVQQQANHKGDLEQRRDNVKNKKAHQKVDAANTPFDIARESAGAAVEMKI